jgi:hypothetical protein
MRFAWTDIRNKGSLNSFVIAQIRDNSEIYESAKGLTGKQHLQK